MGRSCHDFVVSETIPSHIPITEVIRSLHGHAVIMELQALTTGFHEVPLSAAGDAAHDPYFANCTYNNGQVYAYEIAETVTILPGVGGMGKRNLKFHSLYQNQEDGVKAVGFAPAGIVVKAYFKVEKSFSNANEYILTEYGSGECQSMLLPFIKGSMTEAHKNIVKDLIKKIDENVTQGKMPPAPGVPAITVSGDI